MCDFFLHCVAESLALYGPFFAPSHYLMFLHFADPSCVLALCSTVQSALPCPELERRPCLDVGEISLTPYSAGPADAENTPPADAVRKNGCKSPSVQKKNWREDRRKIVGSTYSVFVHLKHKGK